jgi:hypothetical protein
MELWSVVSGNEQKPIKINANVNLNTYAKLDNYTLNFIIQSLSNSKLMIICEESIAKGM